MKRKKRDWVWITMDDRDDLDFDCKLFDTAKPPIIFGCQWYGRGHGNMYAFAKLCARGLAAHGFTIKPGECKKARVKLEVIE